MTKYIGKRTENNRTKTNKKTRNKQTNKHTYKNRTPEQYTDISCLGGVFAKNTSRETKFSLKTGIFSKYPSQT
jgi:hypothetical protein